MGDTGTIQVKDPGERKRLPWDWSDWLGEDTIVSSEFDLPPDLVPDDESHGDTTAEVWVTGGTLGEDYDVTNWVTTASGAIAPRTMRVQCRKR